MIILNLKLNLLRMFMQWISLYYFNLAHFELHECLESTCN